MDRLVVMRVCGVVVKNQQEKVWGGKKGDRVPIICAFSLSASKNSY